MEDIMLDVLGHPVNVGDIVLTGHYGAVGVHLVTKIVKTTPKAVYVNVDEHSYDFSWQSSSGSRTGRAITKQKLVRRRYDQVVVVDKQLEHNKRRYPEYLI